MKTTFTFDACTGEKYLLSYMHMHTQCTHLSLLKLEWLLPPWGERLLDREWLWWWWCECRWLPWLVEWDLLLAELLLLVVEPIRCSGECIRWGDEWLWWGGKWAHWGGEWFRRGWSRWIVKRFGWRGEKFRWCGEWFRWGGEWLRWGGERLRWGGERLRWGGERERDLNPFVACEIAFWKGVKWRPGGKGGWAGFWMEATRVTLSDWQIVNLMGSPPKGRHLVSTGIAFCSSSFGSILLTSFTTLAVSTFFIKAAISSSSCTCFGTSSDIFDGSLSFFFFSLLLLSHFDERSLSLLWLFDLRLVSFTEYLALTEEPRNAAAISSGLKVTSFSVSLSELYILRPERYNVKNTRCKHCNMKYNIQITHTSKCTLNECTCTCATTQRITCMLPYI